jgi:hypothetical protein
MRKIVTLLFAALFAASSGAAFAAAHTGGEMKDDKCKALKGDEQKKCLEEAKKKTEMKK